jgi:hypothetical protein
MTPISQNLIQEEIKSTANSWNACNNSVQNILFSRMMRKNINIKIYKTIVAPEVPLWV